MRLGPCDEMIQLQISTRAGSEDKLEILTTLESRTFWSWAIRTRLAPFDQLFRHNATASTKLAFSESRRNESRRLCDRQTQPLRRYFRLLKNFPPQQDIDILSISTAASSIRGNPCRRTGCTNHRVGQRPLPIAFTARNNRQFELFSRQRNHSCPA